ncbi:response regulator transcription factor [Gorillibacterium sp. sgz500922]|uniref:response regulator transcription factor n=1 Tax=Gorillibacterium sp. sgz500922 TaxID=3446694 RepID=UPI003F676D16
MNLLIADDEPAIRSGIGRAIEQLFPDSTVHTAASASEAVQILDAERIDIVLTDILMPGMSGLELMRITKRKYPRIQWVVISAHSEFRYAQEAVRLGARDYLLKPIGRSRLQELIRDLAEEVRQDDRRVKESERLKASQRFLREGVFQRLALGLDTGNLDIGSFMEEYGGFYLILVQFEAEDRDVHLEHFIVENVLSELIESRGKGFVTSCGREALLALAELNEGEEIDALLQEAERHIKRYVKLPFHLAGTGRNTDAARIAEQVALLKRASRLAAAREATEPQLKGSGEAAIEVALAFIREHYSEDLSLEKVASIVYLNPVYFSQLFKQKTGQGYKDYVIQLRLTRAKELLLDPRLRLAEIAARVGYQDVRHFTTLFRKRFELTPGEYRQQQEVKVLF